MHCWDQGLLTKSLREVKERAMWISGSSVPAFQVEGTASVKALRQEKVWQGGQGDHGRFCRTV